MVYTNMNILYWYELEMAVLPFTSIGCITLCFNKQKGVKHFSKKNQLNFPTEMICVNVF